MITKDSNKRNEEVFIFEKLFCHLIKKNEKETLNIKF